MFDLQENCRNCGKSEKNNVRLKKKKKLCPTNDLDMSIKGLRGLVKRNKAGMN